MITSLVSAVGSASVSLSEGREIDSHPGHIFTPKSLYEAIPFLFTKS